MDDQITNPGFIDMAEMEIIQSTRDGSLSAINPEAITHHHFVRQGGEGTIGLYGREIRINAGDTITGKLHKTDHLFVLARGVLTVWNELGESRTLEAGAIFVAPAGTRRLGYAHEDCVILNVHGTNETDLETIEREMVVSPVTINNEKTCLG